jgi:hypothetical protein
MSKQNIVNKVLDVIDDIFFSTGNINKDYDIITQTIKQQGFWAGVSYRYYFDDKYNLVKTESRF